MAESLTYDPLPPPPTDTAYDELHDFVQTLHESGTLRVLNGLLGQFQDVMAVVTQGLDTPGGRNGLSNLLILVKLLGQLDADRVDTFFEGVEKGLGAAGARVRHDEAPSLLGLLNLLRDEDTRRGLAAVLTLLQTLGQHLHEEKPALPQKS